MNPKPLSLVALFAVATLALASYWTTMHKVPHYSGVAHIYYASVSDDGNFVAYLGGNLSRSDLAESTYSSNKGTYTGPNCDVYLVDRSGGLPGTVTKINASPYVFCGPPRISRDGGAVTFFAADKSNVGLQVPLCYIVSTGTLYTCTATFNTLADKWPPSPEAGVPRSPGISNAQSDGSYWVACTDFSPRVDRPAPALVKWNPGNDSGALVQMKDADGNPVTPNAPDLDSGPSYQAIVNGKGVDGEGTDPQVYRVAWPPPDNSDADTELVSHTSGGAPCNGVCDDTSIDGAGAHIAFDSTATDLISGPSAFNAKDVYYGVRGSSSWAVSMAYDYGSSGGDGASVSQYPRISGPGYSSGWQLAFESNAQNLATEHSFSYGTGTCAFAVQVGSPVTLDCVSSQPIPGSDPWTAREGHWPVPSLWRSEYMSYCLFDTPASGFISGDSDSYNDIYEAEDPATNDARRQR